MTEQDDPVIGRDGSAALAVQVPLTEPVERVAARAEYRFLGIFRFLLALMVLCQHYQYLLPDADRWPFRRWGLGIIAVDLFFVISGFIIAEANASFYRGRPWSFLGNRLLRIVPPYLAALLLSVAVHQLLWQAGKLQVWDYTLDGTPVTPRLVAINVLLLLPAASQKFVDEFQFIPFVWSLRVELTFYLYAFLAVWFALRAPQGANAESWERRSLAAAILGGFALLMVFFMRGRPEILGNAVYFEIGTLLFLWVSGFKGKPWWLAASIAASGVLAMFTFPRMVSSRFPWVTGEQVVILALLGVLLMLLLGSRVTDKGWRKVDRRFGDLSYPLYLNHYVVGIVLYDLSAYRGLPLYLLGLLLSVGLAALMNAAVEAPLRRLRDGIRGSSVS